MNKMTSSSRIILCIASLILIATLFLPIWKIEMSAPQYPEGLEMKIWLDKMSGDVDVINGLNHYIGMRHIEEDDFVEFKVLPYIVMALIVIGLVLAFIGKRKGLYFFACLLILFGVAALLDYYKWGYEQLLNFGAYSIPDWGGWIFATCGILVLFSAGFEWYKNKKKA
jgi:copper chaperone NosL